MTQQVPSGAPNWFYAVIALCLLAVTGAIILRFIYHPRHDWVQLDQHGTGDWKAAELVIPRVFDRLTGETCEFRGHDAKKELVSQVTRGPWVCYPGPTQH